MRELGHPEHQYPCIHIAGTNGKGSTAAMIASVLTASGYRTGLYTSPHLVAFNERIRVDGKKISDESIVQYVKKLKKSILQTRATFFEATTAMAFQYFADQKVDIAVVETGLGGRYDATNVVTPLVTIITSIGLEHTEHLGQTLEKIAFQKGGIIKPHVPCITGVEDESVLKVLGNIAKEKKSALIQLRKNIEVVLQQNRLEGITVSATTSRSSYHDFFVSLGGQHQTKNFSLALLALEYLKTQCGLRAISHHTMREGMENIATYSGLRGRLDILQRRPLVVADAAHNPESIQTLVDSLKNVMVGKVCLLFGVMKDKEYTTMIKLLQPMVRMAITISPNIERAVPAQILSEEFHRVRVPSVACGTANNAISLAMQEVRSNEPILITGSQYLLGDVMKELNIVF